MNPSSTKTAHDIAASAPKDPGEIDREFEKVLADYGESVGGPSGLAALPAHQKWQIISMVRVQREAKERTARAEESGGGKANGNGGGNDDDDDDDDDNDGGGRLSFLRGGVDDDELDRSLQQVQFSPIKWLDRLRDHHIGGGGQLSIAQATSLKLQMRAA